MHDEDTGATRELVFGVLETGELVFIERERAHALAEIHRALEEASTWGELRSRVSRRAYAELEAIAGESEGRDRFRASDPFQIEMIPPYFDGDYPGWPAREMLALLPPDIYERFGDIEQSVVNGRFARLDPGRSGEIVAALEERGFRCRRDDALVGEASGYR